MARLRVNPVEYGIFATVTLMFMHSMYSLLYMQEDLRFTAMTPMLSSPTSESRAPAAVAAFVNVELKCEGRGEQATRAGKLRLSGPLCPAEKDSVEKATVVNDTNRFTATVFTDRDLHQFSTDYIPLNTGRNLIKIDFALKNGQSVSQELVVNRE